MATTKMTNKIALETAIAVLSADNAHDEVVAKLQKMLESVEKKNSKTSGKLTPKQVANLEIGESVVKYLRENPTQMFSIAELLKNVPNLPEDMSSQRLTAVFRQDNVRPYFRRDTVKGKSYFQYFEAVEEEVEE
jgi:hypothetical protein